MRKDHEMDNSIMSSRMSEARDLDPSNTSQNMFSQNHLQEEYLELMNAESFVEPTGPAVSQSAKHRRKHKSGKYSAVANRSSKVARQH